MWNLISLIGAWAKSRRMQLAYAPARRITLGVTLAVLGWTSLTPLAAQLPESRLKVLGLQTMWQAQLDMPLDAGTIVSTHLWTNPNDKKVYAELTLPVGSGLSNRTLRVAAQLAPDGKSYLIDQAKKQVETQAARILGRYVGSPASEVSVPVIYLVVVSSDGLVQAYDAETGAPLWKNTCGSVRSPAAPASVSDLGIVVHQADTLYLLDWKTGKHLQRRKTTRSTSTGVALVGNVAFTSSHSGQVEGFDMSDPSVPPLTFQLRGRSVAAPAASDRAHSLVAFANDRGEATLFFAGEKVGPWFQVSALHAMSGPLTFTGGALYIGDTHGQLSKIGLDRLGKVEWRAMMNESLGSSPMLIGRNLYAASEIGQLIALDDTNGFTMWTSPASRVKSILAGNADRLYCRSLTDRLLVIDTRNGGLIGETSESRMGHAITNHLNDRLYVVSGGGLVQAIREIGKEHALPSFHVPLPAPTEETPAAAPAAPATGETPPVDDANPFGVEEMAPASEDPFAVPGGDTPF